MTTLPTQNQNEGAVTRRRFFAKVAKGAALFLFGGMLGGLVERLRARRWVWQIDPQKCVQCGNCATACVLAPSAVRCMHAIELCGYCDLCFGFFQERHPGNDEGAENQACPTGALLRRFVEDPYYEYRVDRARCIGCAKCVKGCRTYGNSSLYLQVQRDLCVDCNQCAIALRCEGQAFRRIPVEMQYLPRRGHA